MAIKGLKPKLTFPKARFEKSKANKQLGRAVRKILGQAGGFTRTVARRSMKKKAASGGDGLYGEKISAAGSPPKYLSKALKDSIYFHADRKRRLVIIGPTPGGTDAAEALEYGGTVQGFAPVKVEMRIDKKDGKRKLLPALVPAGGRAGLSGNEMVPAARKRQSLRIKPRPYMRPAFDIMMATKLKDWLQDPSIPRSLKNILKQQKA